MGLLWLLSAALDGWDGEWSSAFVHVPGMVIAGLMLLGGNRWRVETDNGGERVVGLVRTTFVPWSDVAEIRGNAGAKSTHLVLVARSGRRLRLPLNPTIHRRLVALWQENATTEPPQQAD